MEKNKKIINNISSKNKSIKKEKINNKKIKFNKKIINKIKNKINNKEKNNKKINSGIFSEKDFISPTYINLKNPKYLEIDEYFYSGIIIVNYYREYNE